MSKKRRFIRTRVVKREYPLELDTAAIKTAAAVMGTTPQSNNYYITENEFVITITEGGRTYDIYTNESGDLLKLERL